MLPLSGCTWQPFKRRQRDLLQLTAAEGTTCPGCLSLCGSGTGACQRSHMFSWQAPARLSTECVTALAGARSAVQTHLQTATTTAAPQPPTDANATPPAPSDADVRRHNRLTVKVPGHDCHVHISSPVALLNDDCKGHGNAVPADRLLRMMKTSHRSSMMGTAAGNAAAVEGERLSLFSDMAIVLHDKRHRKQAFIGRMMKMSRAPDGRTWTRSTAFP